MAKKQVMVGFVGSGKRGNSYDIRSGGYETVEYLGFPDGKGYVSNMFTLAYLEYALANGIHYDVLLLFGTYASDYATLLGNVATDEAQRLRALYKEYQGVVSKGGDYEPLINEVLEGIERHISEKYAVPEVQIRCHDSSVHDNDSIAEMYNAYRGFIDEIGGSDALEITLDITHSLRYMPIVFHQVLSESDTGLSHIVYGEYINGSKTGSFRNFDSGCALTRINRGLFFAEKRMNYKYLAEALADVWPEAHDVLLKLDNIVQNSVVVELGSIYRSICGLCEFTDEELAEYRSVLVGFDSLMAFLNGLKADLGRDLDNPVVRCDDTAGKVLIIANYSDMLVSHGLNLLASIANESAVQYYVMGRVFDEAEEYEQWNKAYSSARKKIQNKIVRDGLNEIIHTRNDFAHNLGSTKKVSPRVQGIQRGIELLRGLAMTPKGKK